MASNVHPERGLRVADLGAGAHAAPVLHVLQVQGLDVILEVVLELELFAAIQAAPEVGPVIPQLPAHLPIDEVSVF